MDMLEDEFLHILLSIKEVQSTECKVLDEKMKWIQAVKVV
nr:hypothetical protein [Tanacetum cinerariifolium]